MPSQFSSSNMIFLNRKNAGTSANYLESKNIFDYCCKFSRTQNIDNYSFLAEIYENWIQIHFENKIYQYRLKLFF